MEKTCIAIVIPGGIGTGVNNIGIPVLEQTIKKLSKEFKITVFQLFPLNEKYEVNGFELVSIESSHLLLRSIKFFAAFWKVYKKKRFKIVHAFWALPSGFISVVVGKLFRLPTIVSLQGGDAVSIPEIQYGQLLHWWKRIFVFWTLKNCTHLISPSQYLVCELKKNGFNRKDIGIIPLGVDTNYFHFHIKEINSPINFLHVGNFNRVKDQITLIKAFKLIQDKVKSKLIIIGEGPEEFKLISIVKELNLENNIFFIKEIPNASLREYYHQADIFLHTSLSEGHPIVAEEAMSCGVTVCGTKVGLLHDLPDCAVTVDSGDYSMLATQVLTLLDNKVRRNQIIESARRWCESHSINWTIEKYMKIYNRLANPKAT